ncbi:MAG: hypothetical protein AAF363_17155 [Bacteroidota bacterium]
MNGQYKNIIYTLAFGTLSALLSIIQFQIPDIVGGSSDLREIPLLISIFYLTSPWYVLGEAFISSLILPPGGSFPITIITHSIGLFIIWHAYHFIRKFDLESGKQGLAWLVTTFIYYLFIMIPLIVVGFMYTGVNPELSFTEFYSQLVYSVRFEMITSALVTSIYLVQHKIRDTLNAHLNTLEDTIQHRTEELASTIDELNDTNEELKSLNDELDDRVNRRTQELEKKNTQLTEYAFINSHLLRAPLARILGLATLIEQQSEKIDDDELMTKFRATCEELDYIIKLIGRVLEENSQLSKEELMDVQNKIKKITG